VGNVTVFSGFRELGDVRGIYCGKKRPPRKLEMPTNAAAVVLTKTPGSRATFSAKWKKIKGE